MIDEKRLIELLNNSPVWNHVEWNSGLCKRAVLDIISNQPKVNQWIPCSDHLPIPEKYEE